MGILDTTHLKQERSRKIAENKKRQAEKEPLKCGVCRGNLKYNRKHGWYDCTKCPTKWHWAAFNQKAILVQVSSKLVEKITKKSQK